MTPYELEKEDLAGFDLVGTRQDDGTIELGSGETVETWPVEVTPGPGFYTYGLEWVKKQTDDGVEQFEPSDVPDEPGQEWGIYV